MYLYNTLSRKKELFSPFLEKRVTMYVCGITPYDTTHLGHAFTYIFFDVLFRYLTYKNYNVVYTQNVTDINDRDNDILKRAKEQHTSWEKIADFWTKRFLDDMQKLHWVMPKNYLKASENIVSMISLIENILKADKAYTIHGGVYLDITKVESYGKLSRFNEEQMITLAKDFDEDIENPDKKHPLDITLWRPMQKGQSTYAPSFDSPFGKGRPGWHIECSAMAISSLGEQIDIHGGGNDLIYPHHESEIAQSESTTKKIPFAKYWLHTGTVMHEGEKMSKSLRNLILVKDLLKKYSSSAIRWVLLSHQYRQAWEFDEKELSLAQENIKRIKAVTLSYDVKGGDSENNIYRKTFEEIMNDDMNTPHMLLQLLQWVEEIPQKEGNNATLLKDAISDCMRALGFNL